MAGYKLNIKICKYSIVMGNSDSVVIDHNVKEILNMECLESMPPKYDVLFLMKDGSKVRKYMSSEEYDEYVKYLDKN